MLTDVAAGSVSSRDVAELLELDDVDVDVEVDDEVDDEVVCFVACALVCAAVVVVELELTVVTETPGQSAWMPMPFWKTPMMLVSPTSTLAQFFKTSSTILASPLMQAELQCALPPKSSALQPSIVVVYTA